MENLTSKQQEIIQSIKEQFALINLSRPKASDNPFLNYSNEVNEVRRLESEERALVEVKNNAIVFSRKETIERDSFYLRDLLSDAGLEDIIDWESDRDSIKLYHKNYEMWIHYELIFENHHSFIYADSITEYGCFIIKYRGKTYDSIQDVINSEGFKSGFQKMLNHSK